jgi:hypothetical protein
MQIRTNAPAVLQKIVKIGNAVPMQDSKNNEKQNIKKGQIIGFLQETTVSQLSCNNPKSALAGLENW